MRFGYPISTIVAGAGAIVATMLAAALVALNAAGRQNFANLTGTVQLGGDGSGCQRFVIDNKTGSLTHDPRVACGEPAKESKREAAKARPAVRAPQHPDPRHPSTGRIDAVRDSFNGR
jgi:hypothetical protein